jgi:large subunit ribosomal protein L4
MRQAALRSALSVKAAANNLVVVDELRIAEPKTKLMVQALQKCVGDSSTLILVPEKSADYKNVELSVRNMPDAKTLLVNYINVRDLLGYDRILLPIQALEKISAHLG